MEINLSEILIENTFENVICKTASILSRPQCITIEGCCVLKNSWKYKSDTLKILF